SIPLRSFIRTPDDNAFNVILEKIQGLSLFLREVIFKAQLFVNHYILKHPQGLSNEFFQQNFWYSVCHWQICSKILLSYPSSARNIG
ncbi:uncharacterized protein B0P05DRAFT_544838, partial [Gilbertella persicaria]|uniref:uncharacterized protein n=1 Tax=Gilbertella persicaria TaxID=101096 RepID=UPI002221019B